MNFFKRIQNQKPNLIYLKQKKGKNAMGKNKNNLDKETRLKNIENAVREILINVGEDVDREGLIETPKRVAKMYEEILSTKNVDDFKNYKLFDVDLGDSQEMVLVKEIPFFSMCEHHMFPFFGKVHVAYIPQDNRVIGLSKIPRLVEFVSRKLSVQEEITVNVAKKLIEILNPLGVAVVVEARHMCIEMRGINKIGSVTKTSFYSGEFKENVDRRKEFLDGIK